MGRNSIAILMQYDAIRLACCSWERRKYGVLDLILSDLPTGIAGLAETRVENVT